MQPDRPDSSSDHLLTGSVTVGEPRAICASIPSSSNGGNSTSLTGRLRGLSELSELKEHTYLTLHLVYVLASVIVVLLLFCQAVSGPWGCSSGGQGALLRSPGACVPGRA